MSEKNIDCPECGVEFTSQVTGTIKCESTILGVYYEGDPICDYCKEEIYENAFAEYESQQLTNGDNE